MMASSLEVPCAAGRATPCLIYPLWVPARRPDPSSLPGLAVPYERHSGSEIAITSCVAREPVGRAPALISCDTP